MVKIEDITKNTKIEIKPQKLRIGQTIKCNNCETWNSLGMIICNNCGKQILNIKYTDMNKPKKSS